MTTIAGMIKKSSIAIVSSTIAALTPALASANANVGVQCDSTTIALSGYMEAPKTVRATVIVDGLMVGSTTLRFSGSTASVVVPHTSFVRGNVVVTLQRLDYPRAPIVTIGSAMIDCETGIGGQYVEPAGSTTSGSPVVDTSPIEMPPVITFTTPPPDVTSTPSQPRTRVLIVRLRRVYVSCSWLRRHGAGPASLRKHKCPPNPRPQSNRPVRPPVTG